MNKIYLLSIDSTIKTFSVVDGGVGVRYVLDDQFDGIVLNVDDVLLGFVSQGVDEIRSSYRVLAVDDNSIELEKEIERASGVPISMFMPQLSACLSSLLSGVEIVDLDQELASKIYDILLGKTMTAPKLSTVGPCQLITYGAPGTGKSYKIDKCTNESNSIRVTFHPDTDYAAFVGAYKPTMSSTDKGFLTLKELAAVLQSLKDRGETRPEQKLGAEFWQSFEKLTPADVKSILENDSLDFTRFLGGGFHETLENIGRNAL